MKTKTASVLLALFTSLFFLISCQQKNENKTQASQNNFSSQNTKIHEPYDYELDQVFIAPEESDEPVQMSCEGEQMYFTSENQEKELFQVTEAGPSVEIMEEELSAAQIAIRKLEKALEIIKFGGEPKKSLDLGGSKEFRAIEKDLRKINLEIKSKDPNKKVVEE